jgi:hypothetical protein
MTMASFVHTATANRREQCFDFKGEKIDWRAMLDIDCNPTDDGSDAVVAIYEFDPDQFVAIDLRLFRETGSSDGRHLKWLESNATIAQMNGTAVNRRGKFFRLENDGVLPFKRMLDIHGNVTTDPDSCIVAVFELPNGLYRGLDLREFEHPDNTETLQ